MPWELRQKPFGVKCMFFPKNVLSTLVVSSIGFVVVQIDVSIVNLALPQIVFSLNAKLIELQWVIDGYAISFASFLLMAGVLGDRLGNKRIFLAGLLLFSLTSFACGLASSVYILILSRVMQGIGAALVLPTSIALIIYACGGAETVRAKAIGWWSAIGAFSMAAGPLLGGVLVEKFGWKSIFFVNVPLCALGYMLAYIYTDETAFDSRKSFDWKGQILALLALTILTASFIGGGSNGWGHPTVLAGFSSALIIGATFLIHEARSSAPMIPFGLFKLPGYPVSVFVGAIISFSFFGLIFILSLYFQRVRNYTPLMSGLAFCPLTIVLLIANLMGGSLTVRFGYRRPMVVGLVVGALGYLLLMATTLDTTFLSAMTPSLMLIAWGTGMTAPAMTAAALMAVEQTQTGTASAVLTTSRQMGGVFGVAIFGSFIHEDFNKGSVLAYGIAASLFFISAYVVMRQRSF